MDTKLIITCNSIHNIYLYQEDDEHLTLKVKSRLPWYKRIPLGFKYLFTGVYQPALLLNSLDCLKFRNFLNSYLWNDDKIEF